MRIGLDFRFFSAFQRYATRGIPRFTQDQLQSVLAIDSENTYFLLCNPGDDLASIRPEIRAAANAHIVYAPGSALPSHRGSSDARTALARYGAYQRWIEGLHLDLYHSTCHFWVSDLILPGFDACPYVGTAYDFWPVLYPTRVDSRLVELFHVGLLFLAQATRIAAISQKSADSVIEQLGVPADRVDLTRPAVSSGFRPLPREVTQSILAALALPARRQSRKRVRIPREYVLCVTDLHYTKNLRTLLAAYSGLPAVTRAQFPLVLAGFLTPEDIEVVEDYARRFAIDSDIIFTGRVSDHELLGLYTGATVMVHPSHLEGFGLTVAEAMRCGAPVITTTGFALPEVTDGAAIMVDSEDPSAFTDAMERLLHDPSMRRELSRRGQLRGAQFTNTALGEATLDCYRKAVFTAASSADASIRVAVWSPVAPPSSGPVQTTDDLLTALAVDPKVKVDIFVDDDVEPPLEMMRLAAVRHWSDYARCSGRAGFDATIYEVGASPLGEYIAREASRVPGTAVLQALRAPWSAPVIDAATTCVMTSFEGSIELRKRHPHASVRVIPTGVRDPLRNGAGFDRVMARAYLDLGSAAFVIVVPGQTFCADRIVALMEAVVLLRRAGIDAMLAVVGWSPGSETAAMRSRADDLGIRSSFTAMSAVPAAIADAYRAAADVVVVLADDDPGGTPAEALRACASGRSVVLSDTPAFASIPDDACVRVALPPEEEAELVAALVALAGDGDRRRGLERAARAHFEASATLEHMAEGYLGLIREQAGVQPTLSRSQPARSAGVVRSPRPAARAGRLAYNKLCELEDFGHPDLRDRIREVCPHKFAAFGDEYPRGYEHSADWEAAMSLRTLMDRGALGSSAQLLGVASTTLDIFWCLTRYAGRVVVVERDRQRLGARPPSEADAPFAVPSGRLSIHAGDAHIRAYPDGHFDAAVVCWRATDRVGPSGVALSLQEIRRVIKPGGVLSLVLDVELTADPGSAVPPDVTLLTLDEVGAIVAASGLRPLDELRRSVSHWTLSTGRDPVQARALARARRATSGDFLPEWAIADLPDVVLERCGRRSTSLHLALRRP